MTLLQSNIVGLLNQSAKSRKYASVTLPNGLKLAVRPLESGSGWHFQISRPGDHTVEGLGREWQTVLHHWPLPRLTWKGPKLVRRDGRTYLVGEGAISEADTISPQG